MIDNPPRAPSSAPKGPRNSLSSMRPRGRGGIQKAGRPAPVRVDKDGDLVMGASPAGSRNISARGRGEGVGSSRPQGGGRGGRGSGRGGRDAGRDSGREGKGLTSAKAQNAVLRGMGQASVLHTIRVSGLSESKASSNQDGGLDSLVTFLERKATGLDSKSNRAVRIKKTYMDGDVVIIKASKEDSEILLMLNGFSFAGAKLTLTANESSSDVSSLKPELHQEISKESQIVKDKILAILASRYDTELKLLNLSALGQDANLVALGIFDDKKTITKLFPTLMVVCDKLFKTRQAKREAILSVTLTDNNLVDVHTVTSLASTFPDLKNLDLSRNNFSEIRKLSAWRWKFRSLENLVLLDNPIEVESPDYKADVIRWYPKLQYLNGVQVRTAEEIAAATEALNTPILIAPPVFQDVDHVGENFVIQFLRLYDADRSALLKTYYDAQSSHSISINMTAPRDQQHSVPTPPWAAYTKYSRNLIRITHQNTRMARSHRGAEKIQAVWGNLPATRHPDLTTQAEKYLIECKPMSGIVDPSGQSTYGVDGLQVTIHGEFEEENPNAGSTDKAVRSFSRTFVLGPGLAGQPIRVVTDVMALRAWGPLPALSAIPQSTIAETAAPTQAEQEAMAMKLVEATGMTPDYSLLCVREMGWDLEKAYNAFIANKDQLPADAFIANAGQ